MKQHTVQVHIKRLSIDATVGAAASAGGPGETHRAARNLALTLAGGTPQPADTAGCWQQAVADALTQRLIALGVLSPGRKSVDLIDDRTEP